MELGNFTIVSNAISKNIVLIILIVKIYMDFDSNLTSGILL